MTKHQSLTPAIIPDPAGEAPTPNSPTLPATQRHDGWTPERQRLFIEALADSGCVSLSARAVGMSASSAYRLRRRTDARAFDAAWDAALERAMERLIPAAIERALHGSIKRKWYHGEVIAEEHVVSERLLIWLLEKGAAMLGHARARAAMRTDWDAALEGVGRAGSTPPEPDRPYRFWHDDLQKAWLTDAPPPPGYEGWSRGKPGEPHFARRLCVDEKEAMERRQAAPPVSPWQDEARRRFFGLERIPAYDPGLDALAVQAAQDIAAGLEGDASGSEGGA